ncbi:MAG: DUF5131 family protein [Thermoanaerobaculia bacterium]
MGERTGIAWTDHTFNPWRGCEKVSPGCANCYAATLSKRNPAVLGEWGKGSARVMAAESYWRLPVKWNLDAQKTGIRRRVFCASLADVFEVRPDLEAPRARLFRIIEETPWLDWQLLTKRPESARWLALKAGWGAWPSNAWAGVTAEDQQRADERIPELLKIQADTRFVSYEPAIGPVDFRRWLVGIDWIIFGGESGNGARQCDAEWARSTRKQCAAIGIPFFMKQLGAVAMDLAFTPGRIHLVDRAGSDPSEWPPFLRVQEFPW